MNTTELEKEYLSTAPLCNHFAVELSRQLGELLSQADIALGFPIQYRVKTFDSIVQKKDRGALAIGHIQDAKDLVGLRIILLFRRDVDAVCSIIKKHLAVISEENTEARLRDGEFGYASVHFQVGLKAGWKRMPTFKKSCDLQAEIQVRTLAQHIWAAASHILQYKHEAGVPPPIRRSIHRASALLETVDLEFERVLVERKTYLSDSKATSADESLNVDLLAKVLDEELPAKNKHAGGEPYAGLLRELLAFGFDTPQKLKALLAKHRKAIEAEEAGYVERSLKTLKTGGQLVGSTPDRIDAGVYFTHVGMARSTLRAEVGKKWEAHKASSKE